jgi:exo-1,4-beta-D-glucosaminidase
MTLFLCTCKKPGKADRYEIILDKEWHIGSSMEIQQSGESVSTLDLDLSGWYPATVPCTVFAALQENGQFQDPFFGKKLESIPSENFKHSWWYRKEFELEMHESSPYISLNFDGINYSANLWLNGRQIASVDEMRGAFRTHKIDITDFVNKGKNVLAAEIFPPQPGDFTIGFVDWNPKPPDKNMGIWRPVRLQLSGPVSIGNPFVTSDVDLETLSAASLTITAELQNHSGKAVTGILKGEVERTAFSQEVRLDPLEKKVIQFHPDQYDELSLDNPRLWWPNNLGEPNLYSLKLSFLIEDSVSDEENVSFGIRQVSDYMNVEGHRGYKINGKKVLIRGGGWVDDLFLADDSRTLEAKIKYTKHMNLNTIRLEGFWGSSHELYDLCDKYGILLMAGWSCQWEWIDYLGKECDEFGGIKTPEDMELIALSLRDQVILFRNHPSIFVWVVASDMLPRPELETKYARVLNEYDKSRPYLAAAAGLKSDVSGLTGVKMNGPYDYVPPIYWFEDKTRGGAYGFNTETGPGPQPPPLESLKKMLPEDHLWPIDDYWDYHCARNEFENLDRYRDALNFRYGKPKDIYDFDRKAQVMNYEAMRAMFEAFAAHKHTTTGVIQWMLNSAWPKLYWQLYDYYLMPNGAFYGAKKASQPVHILYHYADDGIYAVNDKIEPVKDLVAEIRVFDFFSNEIYKDVTEISLEANTTIRINQLPEITELSDVYFLDLALMDSNRSPVSSNFYWLSEKMDVMNYPDSEWFVTPIKEFADFTELNDLNDVKINTRHSFEQIGSESKVKVTLENPTNTIAFFVYLSVVGKKSGNPVLPIYWDDNYISILPGETIEISASYSIDDLQGEEPALKVRGWNISID